MEFRTHLLAGGHVTDPVFVQDNENLIVAWKNVLQCYNTKTAKLIREYKGPTAAVLAFGVYVADNIAYVSACSTTGEIVTWIVHNGLKIFKMQLETKEPKTFNVIGCKSTAVISHHDAAVQATKFQLLDLLLGSVAPLHLHVKIGAKYSLAMNSAMLAVAYKSKLFTMNLHETTIARNGTDKSKVFTCVTCHPEEQLVLTGDSLGRILLWRNFPKAVYTIFHWHSCPVITVAFSASGNYFYSGGAENVLVRWEVNNVYERKFLPRMSGAIHRIAIASDNTHLAVATNDNAIQVLDAQFEPVSTIQHLSAGGHQHAALTYDFAAQLLILNGIPGHLQFFSIATGHMLYNLDVVGQNRVTGEPDLAVTDVTRVALDDRGQWLATVEEFSNRDCAEIRMKYWHFDTVVQQYALHTCIEYAHERRIEAVAFQPRCARNRPICATIAHKEFRLWSLETVEAGRSRWTRYRTGFFRGLDAHCLRFAHDGSLLAIGFAAIVTVWTPTTCTLKCTLAHPPNRDPITSLHFGIANECHLLVAATKHGIFVWNLLTLSLTWTVNVEIDTIVSDAQLAQMVAFAGTHLYVFAPSSSHVVHEQELPFAVKAATCVAVSRLRANRYKMVAMDARNELHVVSNDDDADDVDGAHGALLASGEEKGALFAATRSKVRVDARAEPSRLFTNAVPHNGEMRRLLDVPAHTLPPVQAICEQLLNAIVAERR